MLAPAKARKDHASMATLRQTGDRRVRGCPKQPWGQRGLSTIVQWSPDPQVIHTYTQRGTTKASLRNPESSSICPRPSETPQLKTRGSVSRVPRPNIDPPHPRFPFVDLLGPTCLVLLAVTLASALVGVVPACAGRHYCCSHVLLNRAVGAVFVSSRSPHAGGLACILREVRWLLSTGLAADPRTKMDGMSSVLEKRF